MNFARRIRRSLTRRVPRQYATRYRLLREQMAPRAWLRRRRADAVIVSYPKCGRTWLRMMTGHVLAGHFALGEVDYLASDLLVDAGESRPHIHVSHDDNPHWKRPDQLLRSKRGFRRQRVALLVRDPRDVVVSMYFERTRRERAYSGSLLDFLDEPVGSLDTVIAYYNIWAAARTQPEGFLLLRYEDLHARPASELRRLCDFIGVRGIADATIAEAVEFGAFDNMREMETRGTFASGRLRPGDPTDLESFKTRRGVVGGFVDYLGAEQVARVEDRIARTLDPFFGYSGAAGA